MQPSLRSVVVVSAALALGAACAQRWTGAPPGYSEPGPTSAEADARTVGARAARPAAPADTSKAVSAPSKGTRESGVDQGSLPNGWPADTRSLEVRATAHVLADADEDARHAGKITRGTRVGWSRVVSAESLETEQGTAPKHRRRRRGEPCPSWVEIKPSGWLCSSLLRPSTAPAGGDHLPFVPRGKLAPDDYFHVSADETRVYRSADDVRADVVDKELSTKVMLVSTGVVSIDDTEYLKTDHGLIESALLQRYWPSDFAGIDLRERPPAAWPFAWVYAVRGGRKPVIRSAPSADAEPVRSATRREIVAVLEERETFARIGDGEWIERKHLRVAAQAPPPARVAETDQFIDVDLDEQVLIAYEGRKPVFATLVSTGKQHHATPVGTYRVRAKAATTSMAGDPSVPNRYEVSAVPWAVRFRSGLFIHGVYWHDGFGGILSHGCVNVSPKDASFIYDWIGPGVPDGWSEVEVPPGEGAIIRVRDRANPEPPLFDYTAEDAKR